MKRIALFISLILCLVQLMLAGCSDHHGETTLTTTPSSGEKGSIAISIPWPTADSTAATRSIPDTARSIIINVTQNGQTFGSITIAYPNRDGHLDNIPAGPAAISAIAKNASGTIVATGNANVTVKANQRTAVTLKLTPVDGTIGAEKTNPKDGAEMVWVPAGTFIMGVNHNSLLGPGPDRNDEFAHKVTITRGYWIYKDEVTVAHYREFYEYMHQFPEYDWLTMPEFPQTDDETSSWANLRGWDDPAIQQHPIVNVPWRAAMLYAYWAGGRLPTEAQWEFAARGPENHLFPWGGDGLKYTDEPLDYTYSEIWDPTQCACNYFHMHKSTWPIGSFPMDKSWCCAQDMAGNAAEWCYDVNTMYGGDAIDPIGPQPNDWQLHWSQVHTIRAGSWNSTAYECRCSWRRGGGPLECSPEVGFRCVIPQ